MAKVAGKWMGGGLVAALGLSALSPMQQAGVALTVAGVAMWSAPALAQQTLPGVGIVIKRKPGNAPIIAPTDANGETRITGLEPGLYTVRVFEGAQEVPMRVGRDGRLAFKAWEDQVFPKNIDPRVRMAPTTRRWAEQIAFEGSGGPSGPADLRGGSVWLALLASRVDIDANTSNSDILAREMHNSSDVARTIVAERTRNGPFTDLVDFARRTCPQAAIDFSDASVRFGTDTMLVKRGLNPKNPGFKCARGTGEMELFGKKHNYVGHVTLLK